MQARCDIRLIRPAISPGIAYSLQSALNSRTWEPGKASGHGLSRAEEAAMPFLRFLPLRPQQLKPQGKRTAMAPMNRDPDALGQSRFNAPLKTSHPNTLINGSCLGHDGSMQRSCSIHREGACYHKIQPGEHELLTSFGPAESQGRKVACHSFSHS